jgi:hypothetical protein
MSINFNMCFIFVHSYYALLLCINTIYDYYAKLLFTVTIYYSLFTIHYALFTMHYSSLCTFTMRDYYSSLFITVHRRQKHSFPATPATPADHRTCPDDLRDAVNVFILKDF